jgi:hypothetical protein
MSDKTLKDLFGSLDMMWQGMLGLFIICGFIAVLIMITAKIVSKPKE